MQRVIIYGRFRLVIKAEQVKNNVWLSPVVIGPQSLRVRALGPVVVENIDTENLLDELESLRLHDFDDYIKLRDDFSIKPVYVMPVISDTGYDLN